jgi:hypothetical protein
MAITHDGKRDREMNEWELTDEDIESAKLAAMYDWERGVVKGISTEIEDRYIATAAQKKLVEYVLKWGRWEDSWHFILTKDKADILRDALRIKY